MGLLRDLLMQSQKSRLDEQNASQLRQAAQQLGISIPSNITTEDGVKQYLQLASPQILAQRQSQGLRNMAVGQTLPSFASALRQYQSPQVTQKALSAVPLSGITPSALQQEPQASTLKLSQFVNETGQPIDQEKLMGTLFQKPDKAASEPKTYMAELISEADRQKLTGSKRIDFLKQAQVDLSGERVGAGVTARGTAKETLPLDEKSPFWIDPKTGDVAKPTMTMKEVKESGYVPITQSGLNASATARAALAQLQEYRELSNKLLVKKSGNLASDITRIKANKVKLLAMRQGGNEDAKRLEALFGAIATIARATGDTANIAVAEREFLKNFTPTEDDTVESAMAKADQAERILRAVVEGRGIPLAKPGKNASEMSNEELLKALGQ